MFPRPCEMLSVTLIMHQRPPRTNSINWNYSPWVHFKMHSGNAAARRNHAMHLPTGNACMVNERDTMRSHTRQKIIYKSSLWCALRRVLESAYSKDILHRNADNNNQHTLIGFNSKCMNSLVCWLVNYSCLQQLHSISYSGTVQLLLIVICLLYLLQWKVCFLIARLCVQYTFSKFAPLSFRPAAQ